MKRVLLLVTAAVLVGAAAWAQLRITSFKPDGELTWTNSVSNATYRIEWTDSLTGPWQSFDALTNLNSITTSSNRATLHLPATDVPTYYRVVWSDAPPYAGLYELREYDTNGELVVIGSLWLAGERGSGYVSGTSELHQVGTTNDPPDWLQYAVYPGPQLGTRRVGGGFSGSAFPDMTMIVSPEVLDDNVNFYGFLVGNSYIGYWEWNTGGLSPLQGGKFTAIKQNADKPPSPEPIGTWDYQAWTCQACGENVDGIVVTGQVAFATAPGPVTGTWQFTKVDPRLITSHLLGQGAFTNAIVSNNAVSVCLPSASGNFTLEGQMCGGIYAGYWRRANTNRTVNGQFFAKRTSAPLGQVDDADTRLPKTD